MEPAQCLRLTLLVVDDDPDIREVLHDQLRALGFGVQTAGDGQQALRIFPNQGIEAVLLYLEMPEMDSRQALQHIRHH